MVKIVLFALVAVFAVVALAAPAEEQASQEELASQGVEELTQGLRLPRATCDLLSGFGVADSACAVHCLAKKFKGGWCEKGVCHCRN